MPTYIFEYNMIFKLFSLLVLSKTLKERFKMETYIIGLLVHIGNYGQ